MTDRVLASVPADVSISTAHIRWADVLAAFLVGLESADSRRAYGADWSHFTQFLDGVGIDVLSATPMHVAAHLEAMRTRGLARATRARALSVLREVYAAACRAQLISLNPAREIRLPRADRDPRTPWLTEQQIVALLSGPRESWVERRDRLVLLVLVGLGLRRKSVAVLQVDDLVRAPDGRLAVRVRAKGGKEAVLLFPAWLATEVHSWIASSCVTGPLFPRLRRVGYDDVRPDLQKGLGPGKVRQIVKAAAKRAGIDEKLATPHALRRSFVTIARQRGVALEDLQVALMHSQATTTAQYDRALRTMRTAPGDVFGDLYKASLTRDDSQTGSGGGE